MSGRPRIVLLCPDPAGRSMRGLAIRYTEIARALAGRADAVLATTGGEAGALWSPDRPGGLRRLLAGADAVLVPPLPPAAMRAVVRSGARLCVDLYDPEGLEVLERFRDRPAPERRLHAAFAGDKLLDALRAGHFFVCASERQRDLWIGAMLGAGLLAPTVYDRDPSLRSLIDLLPFGVPAEPPQPAGARPIRERFPQIGSDDHVVLWNGGIWPWLDAPAAIAAVERARERGLPAWLVFMGASAAAGTAAADEARALGGEAALFNDEWVPYGERGGWLAEADCVISAHRDHLETRFAFRTRLLDCLWARVPAVATAGDELADLIESEDLGAVAAPGDPHALAAALEQVLRRGREEFAPRLAEATLRYAWPRLVEPLLRLAAAPADPSRLGDASSALLAVPPGRRLRRAGQRLSRLARLARRPRAPQG